MSEHPECVYLSRAISDICHIKVFQRSSSSPRSVFLALPCSVVMDRDSYPLKQINARNTLCTKHNCNYDSIPRTDCYSDNFSTVYMYCSYYTIIFFKYMFLYMCYTL